jgi:hypothetical protein
MSADGRLVGKRINYAALEALREALCCSWWYRADLERFIRGYVTEHEIVGRLNFAETKREVAAQLTGLLASNAQYTGNLLDLMAELCALDDSFSHLARLEDGKAKVAAAKAAQVALRKHYEAHAGLAADREAAAQRREDARRHADGRRATQASLDELKSRFGDLIQLPRQDRGYKLQPLLHDLFALFDLDPKASFAISGEQIDGAFSFDSDDYLVEARWQDEPADPASLRDFAGKIDTKLKTTLGVFVSINGFTTAAVENHSRKGANMVLVDGEDLYAILEGRVPLPDVLRRKRRHASQTGDIYLKVRDF